MREQLERLRLEAKFEISEADNLANLDGLRVKYLGKKGEVTAILKQMGKLPPDERPVIGQLANEISAEIKEELESRKSALEEKLLNIRLENESLDITIPGTPVPVGHKHPMTTVLDEAKDIFIGMGFKIAEGPEIELSENVFDKLNTKMGHPSRDRQDTFYFNDADTLLLRTHTSPVQVRVMESQKPPIRIISPGRVYRKDEVDATHSPIFHQIEGLVIDEGITMGDLKGTLNALVEQLYGKGTTTRFRPHHFPFTEPSCEVDVQCFGCGGSGCNMCKGEGWIELLGAGMVHPNVLKMCGVDTDKYSGFAFGTGVDRMTMLRFGITDLRLIYENDIRFLSQF